MYNILLISALVSALRWLLYFTEPPLIIIYVSSFSQGLTVGLFIPAALQFVRQQAPQELQSTAVTLYASFGLGLGAWFSTFIGGYLSDYYSIHAIYILFALLSFIGVGIMVYLKSTSSMPNKEEIAS
jgi:PPP family 3-phenylpropionic acid transporter